jgi:long-chain acyl-CoA synthetase
VLYKELNQVWSELIAPGARFEIIEISVRGTNIRTFRNAPNNVRSFWLSTAQFADRDYIVYQDERISYGEAHTQVAAIASWLFEQGVQPGDRVAIAMRNCAEWLLIYWACTSVGVAVVGMNAWWVAEEIDYALKDSKPKVVFCDRERLERILERREGRADMLLVATHADTLPPAVVPWSAVIASGAMPNVDIDPDAVACIFYTSGTTGFPKGAQLSHRSCVANLLNMAFASEVQAAARAKRVAPNPDFRPPVPVALITTPLFHVTATNCVAYGATAAGGRIILMYRWDAAEALKLIEREKVTQLNGVPTMARELISHPDFGRCDTSSLTTLAGGGAPLQPDLVEKIEARAPMLRPSTAYGMTETCGIITTSNGDFLIGRPDSVGRVVPSLEARCVGEQGQTLPQGEVGELWVKGATVIEGYLNQPDVTAQTITDGWLHTGDMACGQIHHIWFLAEPLPRNAAGKFLKRQLRESLMSELS